MGGQCVGGRCDVDRWVPAARARASGEEQLVPTSSRLILRLSRLKVAVQAATLVNCFCRACTVGGVWAGRWSAPRRRPPPPRCAGARERRGAACTDLLPANSSTFPVNGCSSGRENLARCGCPGWPAASSGQGLGRWRALRRRPLASCCAGARERRGAACADLLPDTISPFPVNGCRSGREPGSLRLPGWPAATSG